MVRRVTGTTTAVAIIRMQEVGSGFGRGELNRRSHERRAMVVSGARSTSWVEQLEDGVIGNAVQEIPAAFIRFLLYLSNKKISAIRYDSLFLK